MQRQLRQIIQIGKQSRKAFKVVYLIIISTSKRKSYNPNQFQQTLCCHSLHNTCRIYYFFSLALRSPPNYIFWTLSTCCTKKEVWLDQHPQNLYLSQRWLHYLIIPILVCPNYSDKKLQTITLEFMVCK